MHSQENLRVFGNCLKALYRPEPSDRFNDLIQALSARERDPRHTN